MRRIASHYVYWKELYRMHYVELDAYGALTGVFPLDEELAGTEFYDGILIPALADGVKMDRQEIKIPSAANENSLGSELLMAALRNLTLPEPAEIGQPTQLFLLSIPLTTAKLSADHCGCNGYIKRL